MPKQKYPWTPTRGPFAGQTFVSAAEYREAQKMREAVSDQLPIDVPIEVGQGANGVTPKMAQGLVAFANIGLRFVEVPLRKRDAALGLPPEASQLTLDEVESAALVNAILDAARANKRFAAIVKRVCTVQAGSSLGVTVGSIVAIRLARRQIVPQEVSLGAYLMLGMVASGGNLDLDAGAQPDVGTGPPPSSDVPPPYYPPNGVVADEVPAL